MRTRAFTVDAILFIVIPATTVVQFFESWMVKNGLRMSAQPLRQFGVWMNPLVFCTALIFISAFLSLWVPSGAKWLAAILSYLNK